MYFPVLYNTVPVPFLRQQSIIFLVLIVTGKQRKDLFYSLTCNGNVSLRQLVPRRTYERRFQSFTFGTVVTREVELIRNKGCKVERWMVFTGFKFRPATILISSTVHYTKADKHVSMTFKNVSEASLTLFLSPLQVFRIRIQVLLNPNPL